MVVVPPKTPVTIPVVGFIVATVGLLLFHVPPLAVEVSVAVDPTQMALLPEIVPAVGAALTEIVVFAVALEQPPLPATV